MVGTVAGTIQGEAGGNPAHQFAVATTIYNRLKAGSYGSSATSIVNAPNQYVGSAAPNATARQFAQAIEDGTLPNYGTVGNAVNFQTAGSATTLGRNSRAVNIGGNNFSDRFGTPTENFQPPQYGGSGATAEIPQGAGVGPLPGELDFPVEIGPGDGGGPGTLTDPRNPSGVIEIGRSPTGEGDTGGDYGGGTDTSRSTGTTPEGSPAGSSNNPGAALGGPGLGAGLPAIGAFVTNWGVRLALILLGIVLIAAAAYGLVSGEAKAHPAAVAKAAGAFLK